MFVSDLNSLSRIEAGLCWENYSFLRFQEWIDKRLAWNPSEYNNITSYHAIRDLWMPDLTLYDE